MVSCEVDARSMRSIPEDKVPALRQGAGDGGAVFRCSALDIPAPSGWRGGYSGGDRRVRRRLVDCRRSSAFRRDIALRCQRLRRVGVSSAFPAGAASGQGAVRNAGTSGIPGKRCGQVSCRREPRRVDFPRGFAKSQKTWFTCTVAFRGLAPEGNGASFPSGQRELTVNQPPSCFVGSNPTLATPRWLSGRAPPW